MEPGTIQIGFAFHDGAPLCTSCGVRSARWDPRTGSYFKQCARCLRRRSAKTRRHTLRRPCMGCHKPRREWDAARAARVNLTCSPACNRAWQRRMAARSKAEVLRRLGGRCTCAGCGWHDAACAVTHEPLLEVDHTRNNGATVRTTRKDGSTRHRSTGNSIAARWSLYLRELRSHPTTHGLQLLCANCHRWITHARRQPLDPP